MAEKIGQYLIDDDYRIHRVPGYEKPISLIDKENPRLPFWSVSSYYRNVTNSTKTRI